MQMHVFLGKVLGKTDTKFLLGNNLTDNIKGENGRNSVGQPFSSMLQPQCHSV